MPAQHESCDELLQVDEEPDAQPTTPPKASWLLKCRKLWQGTKKAMVLQGIRDAGGESATTPEEAAKLLAMRWGGVFSPQSICREALAHLAPHVQPIPDTRSVRMDATVIDLEALLPRLRDSAPGPDGVPYSAWSATSSTTIHYLWQAYKALLAGDTPPVEFLASLMVFLPKGAEDSDNEEIERSADVTRPLNLSNTDAKIITKLIERPLGQVAQAMVVRNQFGFVKHRRSSHAFKRTCMWAPSERR